MLSRRRLAAVGVSWIAFGTPMWLLDLATGGELIWTSFATHFVAPIIGWFGIRALGGWPRGTWRWAAGGVLPLLLIARLFTPRLANVNLSHFVQPGWEHWFPSHPLYLSLLLTGAAATFFVVEQLALRASVESARSS